jgi:hypothetical protein
VGRLLLVMGLLSCTGCRNLIGSNRKYDAIEAELRTRERELAEARGELNNSRAFNQAYLRQQSGIAPDAGGGPPFLPVREITLGTGTGGADSDDQPGDESLQVVIVPKDDDGSSVKVPANLTVLAFEIGRNGVKQPIGRWEVGADQLRRTWKGGLFATGYFVPLQWDQYPAQSKVRIAVRLQTLDGRCYEADRDVTVRPVPGMGQPNRDGSPNELPPPIGPTFAPAIPPPTVYIPTPAVPSVPPPNTSPTSELPPPSISRRTPVRVAPARVSDVPVGR